jgi:hypothetical protein
VGKQWGFVTDYVFNDPIFGILQGRGKVSAAADFPHPALGQDFTLCFRVQRHLQFLLVRFDERDVETESGLNH